MNYFWKQYEDPTAKGKCINVEAYFMGNGIAEAVTDWIILAVPFHEVWKLNMPMAQKLAVMGIFGLGALYVLLPFKHFQPMSALLTWNSFCPVLVLRVRFAATQSRL